MHCKALQHTATHCNALQHCKALQHTATHLIEAHTAANKDAAHLHACLKRVRLVQILKRQIYSDFILKM